MIFPDHIASQGRAEILSWVCLTDSHIHARTLCSVLGIGTWIDECLDIWKAVILVLLIMSGFMSGCLDCILDPGLGSNVEAGTCR